MSVWSNSTVYAILVCAFLTSTSFGTTQVPLLYVFRLMTCDNYYKTHSDPTEQVPISSQLTRNLIRYTLGDFTHATGVRPQSEVDFDRCSIPAIESSTALNISLLGATTSIFGILNLFITGLLIKKFGLKWTLLLNVGFPAVRLFIQNVGVEVWGKLGIVIIQSSQAVTVLGGPSGYILVLNSFMTETVPYEHRTAGLGKVAGSMMLGSALGFLLGGVLAENHGIKAPFRVTLVLFLISSVFVAVCFPNKELSNPKPTDETNKQSALSRFFSPFLVFKPKMFITKEGNARKEYGALLLVIGVFLGILATGYLQTLLQLYSTDVFDFGTAANGWLIFLYSTLRGIFLTFVFPRLITLGRRILAKKEAQAREKEDKEVSAPSENDPLLVKPSGSASIENEDASSKGKGFAFDLTYTRYSLLADGALTLLCTFVQEGWQMYLVAAVLPFAAGTGSAAKGTVLQMVGSSATSDERTDALAGISLVENMARLSTIFIFGVIFAAFASIQKIELTFTVNASVAVLGFIVLLFARLPLEGSRRADQPVPVVETIED